MNPKTLLKLEHGALAIFATLLYAHLAGPWWLFAVLFLAPDLAMLGYLAGPRIGAHTYNLAHHLVWPLALIALGLAHTPSAWSAGMCSSQPSSPA